MVAAKRYRNILILMAVQLTLIAVYGFRFHVLFDRRKSSDAPLAPKPEEQHEGNSTTEGTISGWTSHDARDGGLTSSDAGAGRQRVGDITSGVDLITNFSGTDRHRVSDITIVNHLASSFSTTGLRRAGDTTSRDMVSNYDIGDSTVNDVLANYYNRADGKLVRNLIRGLLVSVDLTSSPKPRSSPDFSGETSSSSADSDLTYSATSNETDSEGPAGSADSGLYASDKKLKFLHPNDLSPACLKGFLDKYSEYCETAIVPPLTTNETTFSLCPCIPRDLKGAFGISEQDVNLGTLEAEQSEVVAGGRWLPRSCTARQRIAVIIPFRDRDSHLRVLLRVLHPFLQRQLLDYTIFVVEQERTGIFNKASLMNAGFLEIRSRHGREFDCFIFHDVDMLPEDDRNFYGCYGSPRHVGAYVNKFRYNVMYDGIFGGATAFTAKQFVAVNGYSNEFYGWGGEDDDMFNRVRWARFKFLRFPKCVARYKMIKHKRDKANPYVAKLANRAWAYRPKVYATNGLNSVAYSLISVELKHLYTRILISLSPVTL